MSTSLLWNPFVPEEIPAPDQFAGRKNEITIFEQRLVQSLNKSSANFMFIGERGIGKSALLSHLRNIAEGRNVSPITGTSYHFNCVKLDLSNCETQEQVLIRIINAMKGQLTILFATSIREKFNSYIDEFNLVGAKIKLGSNTARDIENLRSAFVETVIKCVDKDFIKQGLIFFIDEADAANKDSDLGQLLKHICETLKDRNCSHVIFGLAGLPSLPDQLLASHASSVRIFKDYHMNCMAQPDSKQAIDLAIKKGNQVNGTIITISDEARNEIIRLSEGYPHFLQQYGYSAYQTNLDVGDTEICIDDVRIGAFTKNTGAVASLGKNYFSPLYFGEIDTPENRSVLDILAARQDQWVAESDLLTDNLTSKQLVRVLETLTEKEVTESDGTRKGYYRIKTRSFAVWLRSIGNKGITEAIE